MMPCITPFDIITGQHIYMWSVTMEPTVAIATKCAGCLLEFSNGNGGSFISTGIYEWSRDDGA